MARFDDELGKRLQRVNAQITTVQRIYGSNSHVYKRLISVVARVRNDGGTRFTKKMFSGSLRDYAKAMNALESVEHSPFLTKEGRKKIGEKARETFHYNFRGRDEHIYTDMYEFFKNTAYFTKLKETLHDVSDILVDAIMGAFEEDENLSSDMMVEIFDDVAKEMFSGDKEKQLKGETTQELVSDFIERLQRRVEERIEKEIF